MTEPARKNVRTADFKDMESRLPPEIRDLAKLAFSQFVENPAYPSLCLKQLADDGRGRHRRPSWSVRINKKYRAIFTIDGERNVWYWIGSHNDYDSLVGRR